MQIRKENNSKQQHPFSSLLNDTGLARCIFIFCGLFIFSLFTGCATDDPLSTIDAKGPLAAMQYDLLITTLLVVSFIFLTVGGALLFALIRFREKPADKDKALPKQQHGNPVIELGVIVFSVICLLFVAVPTIKGIWFMEDIPQGNSEKDKILEINVYGHQWWWSFEYNDGERTFTTANEMVIPVGQVVKLNLLSNNVAHSFWIPKIAGKKDLIPGRMNSMWIQADETGHYYGQCTEFCGEAHAYMLFRVNVTSEDAYESWAKKQKQPIEGPDGEDWETFYSIIDAPDENPEAFKKLSSNPIKDGARLFMTKGGCVQCHAIEGSMRAVGVQGPSLTRFGSRKTVGAGLLDNRPGLTGEISPGISLEVIKKWVDDDTRTKSGDLQLDNIYRWIRHSEKVKPGNLMYRSLHALDSVESENGHPKMILTDAEFKRIAAYLQTLK